MVSSTSHQHEQEFNQYLKYKEMMILRDTKCLHTDITIDEFLTAHHEFNNSSSLIENKNFIFKQANYVKYLLYHTNNGFELTEKEIKSKLLQFTENELKAEIHPKDLFIKSSPYHNLYKYYFIGNLNSPNTDIDCAMDQFHSLNRFFLTCLLFTTPLIIKNYGMTRVLNTIVRRFNIKF